MRHYEFIKEVSEQKLANLNSRHAQRHLVDDSVLTREEGEEGDGDHPGHAVAEGGHGGVELVQAEVEGQLDVLVAVLHRHARVPRRQLKRKKEESVTHETWRLLKLPIVHDKPRYRDHSFMTSAFEGRYKGKRKCRCSIKGRLRASENKLSPTCLKRRGK